MAADDNAPDPKAAHIERRLSTILAADVAGYSRMMGVNEEATVQTLRRHRAIFDGLLQQHHGRVFNTAGDMILAEFGSAVEAVRCATEIQAALQTRNAQLPVEQRMLFRMGINLGDVIVERGDLLGDGVNVAARLQAIAEPGGICVSGSVHDQILNKLSLQFKPLGKQALKNISLPVRTFSIERDEAGGLLAPGAGQGSRPAHRAAIAAIAACAIAGGAYWFYRDHANASRDVVAMPGSASETDNAVAISKSGPVSAAPALAAVAPDVSTTPGVMPPVMKSSSSVAGESKSTPQATAEKPTASPTATAAVSEHVAVAAAPPVASAHKPPAHAAFSATGSTASDGTYSGRVCNFPQDPAKRTCWKVPLVVTHGDGTGSWQLRNSGKPMHIHAVVADDGSVRATLEGWKVSEGAQISGAMNGTLADGHIDVAGRWSSGLHVDGHWERAR